MERAEPVHTAARVLRRHDLYYISRLHDNVLRHIFILQKTQLFLYISFFCAHWLCYYMYKYIVSCRHANVWRHRCFARSRSTKTRIPSDVNVTPFTFINHPSRAHAVPRSFRR